MDLKQIMTERIKGKLDYIDGLMITINDNNNKLIASSKVIIEKDKKGEDCSQEVLDNRELFTKTMLMNQDLQSATIKLVEIYNISKIAEVELDFSKEKMQRLNFSATNDPIFFIEVKGEIVSKDPTIMEKIIEKLVKTKSETVEMFLKGLRASPEYNVSE